MPPSTAASTTDPRYATSGALHVPGRDGPTYWFSGDVYTLKAPRDITRGSLGFVEAPVRPGGGPVAHVHTRCDEAFYVVAGELEILDGERIFTARAGDFVFIPRGVRHRFKNIGVHTVKVVFLFTPGGDELAFLLGDEAQPGEQPPAWPPERFLADRDDAAAAERPTGRSDRCPASLRSGHCKCERATDPRRHARRRRARAAQRAAARRDRPPSAAVDAGGAADPAACPTGSRSGLPARARAIDAPRNGLWSG